MTSCFYMPPLEKMTGGMAVIAQLANQLHKAGYETIVATSGKFSASVKLDPEIPLANLEEIKVNSEDRFLLPEGWPNAFVSALNKGGKCAIYVQNWAFLHGQLPPDLAWRDLPVRMIAVSAPTSFFIGETCGLNAPVIPPALDTSIFYPAQETGQKAFAKARIGWMPRKNKALAKQIKSIFEARIHLLNLPRPEWLEIDRLSQSETASALRSCQIFLATGFPEGFGLPPLEAMACGCLVAGFTGMGGWEYMRQGMKAGASAPFELPAYGWGANGFFVADGDVWNAAKALEEAYKTWLFDKEELAHLKKAGFKAAAFYSPRRQGEMLSGLWKNEQFWE